MIFAFNHWYQCCTNECCSGWHITIYYYTSCFRLFCSKTYIFPRKWLITDCDAMMVLFTTIIHTNKILKYFTILNPVKFSNITYIIFCAYILNDKKCLYALYFIFYNYWQMAILDLNQYNNINTTIIEVYN